MWKYYKPDDDNSVYAVAEAIMFLAAACISFVATYHIVKINTFFSYVWFFIVWIALFNVASLIVTVILVAVTKLFKHKKDE